MKAAILGNGPSRESYFSTTIKYDAVVGCNVPWTDVDFTIVLDEEVVRKWYEQQDLIKCDAYLSQHAWEYTHRPLKARHFFEPRCLGIVKPGKEYDTSGHVACSLLLKQGYKEIDVYGADSMWEETLESRSHQFFKNYPDPKSKAHVIGWRNRWQKIIEGNPDAVINFRK